MTVNEWSARWKRNEDFPNCLHCDSNNTKEHHFIQTWYLVLHFCSANPTCALHLVNYTAQTLRIGIQVQAEEEVGKRAVVLRLSCLLLEKLL